VHTSARIEPRAIAGKSPCIDIALLGNAVLGALFLSVVCEAQVKIETAKMQPTRPRIECIRHSSRGLTYAMMRTSERQRRLRSVAIHCAVSGKPFPNHSG